MPLEMPPTAPQAALFAPAPECRYVSSTEAQLALQRLRRQLPSTSFDNARPSEICGLVRVELASGKVVYTEPTGRYLLLAFALDTHRGSPADTSEALEHAIEDRSKFPEQAVPGIKPPPPSETSGELLMTPIPPAAR